jgi:hypothetical protein
MSKFLLYVLAICPLIVSGQEDLKNKNGERVNSDNSMLIMSLASEEMSSTDDISLIAYYEPYNGIVTCNQLVQIIYERKWGGSNKEVMFKNGVPECLNDQFPKEWIESEINVNKIGFTKCEGPPCDIQQFPLMGSMAGNDVARIKGKQKIYLLKKIKTLKDIGNYETSSPWYREWYSFNFKDQVYYIRAVSVGF